MRKLLASLLFASLLILPAAAQVQPRHLKDGLQVRTDCTPLEYARIHRDGFRHVRQLWSIPAIFPGQQRPPSVLLTEKQIDAFKIQMLMAAQNGLYTIAAQQTWGNAYSYAFDYGQIEFLIPACLQMVQAVVDVGLENKVVFEFHQEMGFHPRDTAKLGGPNAYRAGRAAELAKRIWDRLLPEIRKISPKVLVLVTDGGYGNIGNGGAPPPDLRGYDRNVLGRIHYYDRPISSAQSPAIQFPDPKSLFLELVPDRGLAQWECVFPRTKDGIKAAMKKYIDGAGRMCLVTETGAAVPIAETFPAFDPWQQATRQAALENGLPGITRWRPELFAAPAIADR